MLEVDARHLLCPMPVIRLQDAAAQAEPGQRLVLIATDPGVQQDVPAWCRMHGHEVRACTETDAGEWRLEVQLGHAE
ncbi:MAG: sulfurtransferase TusA family protein [Gammaproteobacteria bacterium]|jgi:tRNA 2-thiouridine synthesizing protein A